MAPDPAVLTDPAAMGGWFEAQDPAEGYLDELRLAKELLRDARQDLRAAGPQVQVAGAQLAEEDKYLDLDPNYPTFRIEPHPAPCWFTGGKRDDAGDFTESVPHEWERVSNLCTPQVFSPKDYTCVSQGSTFTGYLVEALQAIGLRKALVQRLIPEGCYDAERGLYVVLLYKNARWVRTLVDDFFPRDAEQNPMCCTSSQWPSVCWPAIVEKAYAKRHGSYEGIGGGGSVCEALTDLTGGISGEFGVRDVAADRLFLYLHELQVESLFVARVDMRETGKPGVRLDWRAPYVINRAMGHEGGYFLQLCCPGVNGGPFDEDLPPTLLHSRFFPENRQDGFFWVRVETFQKYFYKIFECRLTLHDEPLESIQLFGQPLPRPLAMRRTPLAHHLYATLGTVQAAFAPEFRIKVHEAGGPCEVYLMVSQDCVKLKDRDFAVDERAPYVPMLVRVYQVLTGTAGGCAKIAQSSYLPARDACVSFKANPWMFGDRGVRYGCSVEFLVRVTMPVGRSAQRLILRCDTTARSHFDFQYPDQASLPGRHTWVEPKEQLSGFPVSFVGGSTLALPKGDPEANVDARMAKAYNDGYGWPKGHSLAENAAEACAVQ